MFKAGECPETVEGMQGLEANKLSGDWFLHKSNEWLLEELTPTCHHATIEIAEDGSFTATEEAEFMGKKWMTSDITGNFTEDTVSAEFFN